MEQRKNADPKIPEREFTILMTCDEICDYIARMDKEAKKRAASDKKLRGGRKVRSAVACI